MQKLKDAHALACTCLESDNISYYFYEMALEPRKCRDKAVDPNQRQCVLKERRFKQFWSI